MPANKQKGKKQSRQPRPPVQRRRPRPIRQRNTMSTMPGAAYAPVSQMTQPFRMRSSFSERLGSVTGAATADTTQTFYLCPGVSGSAQLDNLATLYERYRFANLKIEYRPSVGTTVDGNLVMGVDFDATDLPSTRQEVFALAPKVSGAVWNNMCLPIANREAEKRWFRSQLDSSAIDTNQVYGALMTNVNTTMKTTGELFLTGTVEFDSPQLSSAAVARSISHDIGSYYFAAGTTTATSTVLAQSGDLVIPTGSKLVRLEFLSTAGGAAGFGDFDVPTFITQTVTTSAPFDTVSDTAAFRTGAAVTEADNILRIIRYQAGHILTEPFIMDIGAATTYLNNFVGTTLSAMVIIAVWQNLP